MKTTDLKHLGIHLDTEVPVYHLFSEKFNPDGLREATKRNISLIRDIIQEYNQSLPVDTERPILNAVDAATRMAPVFKGLNHEEAWVLFLNNGNKPVTKLKIAEGDVSSATIDSKRIIREMIMCGASNLILYHNHPSGDPTPSKADIDTTKSLKEMLAVFNYNIVDHIIFSDGRYYSFDAESTSNLECI